MFFLLFKKLRVCGDVGNLLCNIKLNEDDILGFATRHNSQNKSRIIVNNEFFIEILRYAFLIWEKISERENDKQTSKNNRKAASVESVVSSPAAAATGGGLVDSGVWGGPAAPAPPTAGHATC
jgi:hypothetical protein